MNWNINWICHKIITNQKKTIKSKLDHLTNKLAEELISHRFKLEPEQFSPEVTVKHYHAFSKKAVFRCKMIQIPANSNDATTGHKLQGMSKDVIIVTSWPTRGLAAMFKNWEYVVLSQVCTLSGLYLVKPIEMDKSFQPSPQLASYMDKIKKLKKTCWRNTSNQYPKHSLIRNIFSLDSGISSHWLLVFLQHVYFKFSYFVHVWC